MLMREGPALSMCRQSNEGKPLTQNVKSLYWACADIIMRGKVGLRHLTETQPDTKVIDTLHLDCFL